MMVVQRHWELGVIDTWSYKDQKLRIASASLGVVVKGLFLEFRVGLAVCGSECTVQTCFVN